MSANLPSLSIPAAPTAQLALNGAGEAANNPAAASDGNPFAALYQQLLGKQDMLTTTPALLTLPTEESNEAGRAETQESLAAVLPFLEAMGLTQTNTQSKSPGNLDIKETTRPETATEGIIAAFTPQVVHPPAISADKPEMSPNGSAIAEESPVAVTSPVVSAVDMNPEENHHLTKTTNASDEFATQLSAALETNHDASHHPGNIDPHSGVSGLGQHERVTTAPSLPVTQAVGSAAWSDEVGNQVVWMANRSESRAELVLTPPQMGRVEISLSVTGDNATANFVSANPVVREALEAALPRLREVLADAGIQLGQAQVGAENARQFAQQQDKNANGSTDASADNAPAMKNFAISTVSPAGLKFGRGLVDVFA